MIRSNYSIKINGDNTEILSVSLKDILLSIIDAQEYNWSILWLEAVGEPEDKLVLAFEESINSSEKGKLLDWKELIDVSMRFDQITEMLLIGDRDLSKLKRYTDDEEMNSNCDYTIELIDSSYWIIHSKSRQQLLI